MPCWLQASTPRFPRRRDSAPATVALPQVAKPSVVPAASTRVLYERRRSRFCFYSCSPSTLSTSRPFPALACRDSGAAGRIQRPARGVAVRSLCRAIGASCALAGSWPDVRCFRPFLRRTPTGWPCSTPKRFNGEQAMNRRTEKIPHRGAALSMAWLGCRRALFFCSHTARLWARSARSPLRTPRALRLWTG